MILSSVRTNEHDELFRRKGLPALFNEAGFRTWFLSNQSPQGAMIDKLARDADSLIYMGHPRYDMQLLDTMKRIVEADTENDLLFILHCYGSHFSYHQRYPREAAYFLPDDDVAIERQHKQKIWNAYDNSIRYTDYVLGEIVDMLKKKEVCASMLYLSDHGEDIFDDARARYLHASPIPTYYQLHIPYIIWFSNDYRTVFPEKYRTAISHGAYPVSTNSVFHTVLDIASVRTSVSDSTLALTNPAFAVRDRMFLGDHDEPVPFWKVGLKKADFVMLDKWKIAYRKD